MSVIACLGWGSLIWDPQELPVREPWHADGPLIRVEFLRKSIRGRITLVIDPEAPQVPSRWAVMNSLEIKAAVEALRDRERILPKFVHRDIGRWRAGEIPPTSIPDLADWAQAHKIDGVVWTALGHNFHKSGAHPTSEDVVLFLRERVGIEHEEAKNYVRYAPSQIATPYRKIIETALGWSPLEFPKGSQ